MSPSPAADPLALWRDDGPLARALGRPLGRAVPVAPVLLVAGAAAVLLLVAAVAGEGASDAVSGATVAVVVVAGVASAGRAGGGAGLSRRLRWAVPPVLRLVEYAGLIWLAALAGASGPAAAFALLAALAFRHYDLVYRLRHRAVAPPAWTGALALGWEGRLLATWVALVAGVLPTALFAAAALLGVVLVAESASGWVAWAREQRAGATGNGYEDEEDEGQ